MKYAGKSVSRTPGPPGDAVRRAFDGDAALRPFDARLRGEGDASIRQ
ncbi:hypothetical protein MNO14_00570 [Luteimonas sp. S4-F44]|nr:hypothetical protein [Luteimonas sp. S4-F44]UNK42635.1 hypothetical protein MNO14_00570 [Luteimonas sp. S4-F44]